MRVIIQFKHYSFLDFSLNLKIIYILENMIFRRIFELKKDENRKLRRLHNKELHSLYRSFNVISVIKFRRQRCAGNVVTIEAATSTSKVLTGKPVG